MEKIQVDPASQENMRRAFQRFEKKIGSGGPGRGCSAEVIRVTVRKKRSFGTSWATRSMGTATTTASVTSMANRSRAVLRCPRALGCARYKRKPTRMTRGGTRAAEYP